MKDDQLTEVANTLLSFIYTLHDKIMSKEEMIKGGHLPPSHMKVILYLSFEASIHENAPTITEISQHLGISKSNMSPILDKLFQEGMIRRFEDSHDRRMLRITLTQTAQEMLQAHSQKFKENISARISPLSSEDLTILGQLLPTITDILKKI
jgi:DNA-binding MarR family transcriptional regulator